MRTTIEISDEQRAALVHLAAQRGLKGFSALVQEALDRYLSEQASRQTAIRKGLALRGSLAGRAGDELAMSVEQLRAHWR